MDEVTAPHPTGRPSRPSRPGHAGHAALAPGFRLGGRYLLAEPIASGGMAQVWRADDEVLQRAVAVKIMRPDLGEDEVFVHRFRAEALHSARLMHPNITTVFDYGEQDCVSYLVMELVEGLPLSALIRESGPLASESVRAIIGQAALALGTAHQFGVVHRDVKPANILVRADGMVKLTDFGISRALDSVGHTRAGEMLGTPNYVSPEQVLGEQATGASDLYSLGVVAHEMLSGSRPFDRGTPIAIAMAHVHEAPAPLGDDVPQDLRDVIESLLAKDPSDRPDNAQSVAVSLNMGGPELGGLDVGRAQGVGGYLMLPVTPPTPVAGLPRASVGGPLECPTMAAGFAELVG